MHIPSSQIDIWLWIAALIGIALVDEWLQISHCHAQHKLTLPMLRLLSSKAQWHKYSWKPSKPWHVGIHRIALTECSQTSTHVQGFQSFLRFSVSVCHQHQKVLVMFSYFVDSKENEAHMDFSDRKTGSIVQDMLRYHMFVQYFYTTYAFYWAALAKDDFFYFVTWMPFWS